MKKIVMSLLPVVTAVLISACSGSDGTNGADGADGLNIAESALVKVTAEASGTNCLNGGQLIEAGNDTNANGVLDIEEITTSEYICNGTDGTSGTDGLNGTDGIDGVNGTDGVDGTGGGLTALIELSDEPVGVNCEFGGQRIDVGLDDNANTVLDEVEIDNTSYVCNELPPYTKAGMVDAAIEFAATGSKIVVNAQEEMKFLRASNADCDANELFNCNDPYFKTLFESPAVVQDDFISAVQSGSFWLKAERELSNRVSSLDVLTSHPVTPPAVYSHQSVNFKGKLWSIGGRDSSGASTNDVFFSKDGQTWREAGINMPFSARRDHKVIVFNNKLWLIGGDDGTYKNDIWSSNDGVRWEQETAAAGFTARALHEVVVFNNKLWLIGGYDGTYRNDIWSSSDGVQWESRNSSAAFTPRLSHRVVSYKMASQSSTKLWLIGGYDGANRLNDVWSSTDGVFWNEETASADFTGRSHHQVISYNDKLWIVGGWDGANRLNDVLSSSNGISWSFRGTVVDSGINSHQVVNFNNKIWLTGGYNDVAQAGISSSDDMQTWTKVDPVVDLPELSGSQLVAFKNKLWKFGGEVGSTAESYYSDDGEQWHKVATPPPFGVRAVSQVVVFNDKLWLIGGSVNYVYKNDVWSSSDGINWTEETAAAAFSPRAAHQVIIDKDNTFLLVGGIDSSYAVLKDVWHSNDGVTWTKDGTDLGQYAVGRYGHKMVLYNNIPYIFGGFDSSSSLNTVSYRDALGSWIEFSNVPFSSRYHSSVYVSNNKIWINGGLGVGGAKNDVWSWYGTGSGTWTEETAAGVFQPRYDHQIAYFNNKFRMIGGVQSSQHYRDNWSSDNGIGWSMKKEFFFYFE